MATVYRIAKFDDVFVKRDGKKDSGGLRWVSVPISLMSGGYQALIEDFGEEAPAIYGAWIRLVQIAAQCSTPGVLCSRRGRPITPEQAAGLSQMPPEPFRKLFAWAVAEDVGWLEVVSSPDERPEEIREPSGQTPEERPDVRPDKPTEPPGLHNKTIHNTTEQDRDPNGSCAAGAAGDPDPVDPLPESIRASARDWLAYKRERREPYKPTGLKTVITRIGNLTAEHGAQRVASAIERAIANGWKGFDHDFNGARGSPSRDDPRNAVTANAQAKEILRAARSRQTA